MSVYFAQEADGGAIYFAQEADGGPVTIGYSEDLPSLLREWERHDGRPLVLLATLPGVRRNEEAEIHERFAEHRLGRTEQFRPAPDLMAFIGRIGEGLREELPAADPLSRAGWKQLGPRRRPSATAWLSYDDLAEGLGAAVAELVAMGELEAFTHPDDRERLGLTWSPEGAARRQLVYYDGDEWCGSDPYLGCWGAAGDTEWLEKRRRVVPPDDLPRPSVPKKLRPPRDRGKKRPRPRMFLWEDWMTALRPPEWAQESDFDQGETKPPSAAVVEEGALFATLKPIFYSGTVTSFMVSGCGIFFD